MRAERVKWSKFLLETDCVLFVASLSEWSQQLSEDRSINRMSESISTYEKMCNELCESDVPIWYVCPSLTLATVFFVFSTSHFSMSMFLPTLICACIVLEQRILDQRGFATHPTEERPNAGTQQNLADNRGGDRMWWRGASYPYRSYSRKNVAPRVAGKRHRRDQETL